MAAAFPNLELMVYKFHGALAKLLEKRPIESNTEVNVFTQTWPNTGTAFASSGYMYGQAFTKEYTTVILNLDYDFAMVFFGNTLGYYVEHLTDAFMEDLRKQNMVGVHDVSKYTC